MPRQRGIHRNLLVTVAKVECADTSRKEFVSVQVTLARDFKTDGELLKAAGKVLPENLKPSQVLAKETKKKHYFMTEQMFINQAEEKKGKEDV